MDEARCGAVSQAVNGCAAHASRRLLALGPKTCSPFALFTICFIRPVENSVLDDIRTPKSCLALQQPRCAMRGLCAARVQHEERIVKESRFISLTHFTRRILLALLMRSGSREPEPFVAKNGTDRASAQDDSSQLLLQRGQHLVWHAKHQTDTCHKKHRSTLFLYDDHVRVVMTPFLAWRKRRRNDAILSSERKLSRERSLL
jgi:hypothetical protein